MLDRLIRVVVASHLMSLQVYAAFCGWDQAEVHRLACSHPSCSLIPPKLPKRPLPAPSPRT